MIGQPSRVFNDKEKLYPNRKKKTKNKLYRSKEKIGKRKKNSLRKRDPAHSQKVIKVNVRTAPLS